MKNNYIDIMDFILPLIFLLMIILGVSFLFIKLGNIQEENIELIKKTEKIYEYKNCRTFNDHFYCWEEIKNE